MLVLLVVFALFVAALFGYGLAVAAAVVIGKLIGVRRARIARLVALVCAGMSLVWLRSWWLVDANDDRTAAGVVIYALCCAGLAAGAWRASVVLGREERLGVEGSGTGLNRRG